jgi:hypothetical protein
MIQYLKLGTLSSFFVLSMSRHRTPIMKKNKVRIILVYETFYDTFIEDALSLKTYLVTSFYYKLITN